MLERLELLIGKENIEKIQKQNILVIFTEFIDNSCNYFIL